MPTTPAHLIELRAIRRVALFLARWAQDLPRAHEQEAAADAVGNPSLGAACSAWALGVADGAFAQRHPGHHPRFTQSGTRSTDWSWRGATFADGTRIEPLGREYTPTDGRFALPGDIITVGPRGKKPQHTTIVLASATRDGVPGYWCGGFNQAGFGVNGEKVWGELALTFYGLYGAGLNPHKTVTVPMSAYATMEPAVAINTRFEALGRAAFLRLTGVEPGASASTADAPPVCPCCGAERVAA